MMRVTIFIFSIMLLSITADAVPSAISEETAMLKGTISDMEGNAVQGALMYVYNSPDVRRTADFISSLTDKDGQFSIKVPAGKYWLVARIKKGEDYGPLMPGDKHSGDPIEIELVPAGEEEMDFVVADLMEAIKMKKEAMDRPLKITGRIINKNGEPLANVYAIANKSKEMSRIPDYLSAWTDDKGRFTLYIPEGNYYLGGAEEFPPGRSYFISQEITANADKSGIDIVKKETDKIR